MKKIIFILATLLTTPFAHAQWVGPVYAPPACPAGSPGCDAPINVSVIPQTKEGGLTLGGKFKSFNQLLNFNNNTFNIFGRAFATGKTAGDTGDVCIDSNKNGIYDANDQCISSFKLPDPNSFLGEGGEAWTLYYNAVEKKWLPTWLLRIYSDASTNRDRKFGMVVVGEPSRSNIGWEAPPGSDNLYNSFCTQSGICYDRNDVSFRVWGPATFVGPSQSAGAIAAAEPAHLHDDTAVRIFGEVTGTGGGVAPTDDPALWVNGKVAFPALPVDTTNSATHFVISNPNGVLYLKPAQ
ncbi:MAG TPA: hypothetical protein DCZ84_01095 [Candidatus Vogelbacteria bacterium]|uniref:Uncharacterized protein n=1 Tax=Candidatus Vogelbacteria bacterium RIFOXYD1_FULL_51_18 TaxID=1802440 RepID=A0A1G2QL69_9BACT|nr:MAG: hypothetical protein UY68_C0005G0066 [Parcubacteria group bacterium GW2011_GWF2_52_12]OHA61330.1 MAG: hypothetical protein A2569_00560 [Candidatus Vogelbacteria bacterium RIFOXYD1_FULL_51_18]HBB65221.1 hypothetical protein [Candidatus Vogelbacteria bacterium]HBC44227.1 hypothetical protein [Candidatus Vogelbacteria bacterium]HCQ91901.1 hypothetical protein [Candidatus Vogelbacteria bacterium]